MYENRTMYVRYITNRLWIFENLTAHNMQLYVNNINTILLQK